MSILNDATMRLRARELLCLPDADGLTFSGPSGRGRIEEAGAGRMLVRHELPSLVADPVFMAMLAARVPGELRIALVRGMAVAMDTCWPDELDTVLTRIEGLRTLASQRRPRTSAGTKAPPVPASLLAPDPTVVDLEIGLFEVVPPDVSTRVFLRLLTAVGSEVDSARATYVLVANARLRAAKAGWMGGAGVVVGRTDTDDALLRRELSELGQGLRALGDETIARSYLDLAGPGAPGTAALVAEEVEAGAVTPRGMAPRPQQPPNQSEEDDDNDH